MNAENRSVTRTSDEIDLLELSVKIAILLRKYRRATGIALACGVLLSGAVFLVMPKTYSTSMVCSIPFMEPHELEEILLTMPSKNQYSSFGDEDVSAKVWASLKDIEIADNKSAEDGHSFRLVARVYSMRYIDELQEAILGVIQKKGEAVLAQKRGAISRKVAMLEGEVANVNSMLEKSGTQDEVGLMRLKVELQGEMIDLRNQSAAMGHVIVVQGFAVSPSSLLARLAKVIGVGLCASAFLVFVVIAFTELRHTVLQRGSSAYAVD